MKSWFFLIIWEVDGRTSNQVFTWSGFPEGDGLERPIRESFHQYSLTTEQLEQKADKRVRNVHYEVIGNSSGACCHLNKKKIKTFFINPCTEEPQIQPQKGDVHFGHERFTILLVWRHNSWWFLCRRCLKNQRLVPEKLEKCPCDAEASLILESEKQNRLPLLMWNYSFRLLHYFKIIHNYTTIMQWAYHGEGFPQRFPSAMIKYFCYHFDMEKPFCIFLWILLLVTFSPSPQERRKKIFHWLSHNCIFPRIFLMRRQLWTSPTGGVPFRLGASAGDASVSPLSLIFLK